MRFRPTCDPFPPRAHFGHTVARIGDGAVRLWRPMLQTHPLVVEPLVIQTTGNVRCRHIQAHAASRVQPPPARTGLPAQLIVIIAGDAHRFCGHTTPDGCPIRVTRLDRAVHPPDLSAPWENGPRTVFRLSRFWGACLRIPFPRDIAGVEDAMSQGAPPMPPQPRTPWPRKNSGGYAGEPDASCNRPPDKGPSERVGQDKL